MPFTDDDLKRFKHDLFSGVTEPPDALDSLKALIARLEAAEAVIKEADDHGFTDKAIKLETAWRKAAGK